VRRLSAHAHGICKSEPLDALTLAEAAVAVAQALPRDAYPGKAVYELLGTAWKECANAQLLLGDFPGAVQSLDHAEAAYRKLPAPGLGLATVALVRASVFYQQQRLEEAAEFAGEAERGFAHLGDEERRMSAVYLRGGINYESKNFDAAMPLFRQLITYGEEVKNPLWIARGCYSLGNCHVDRGELGEASMHFHTALMLYREVGPAIERVCTDWGIARVLLQGGRFSEAIRRLRDVEAEFESRGMVTDAALVGLHMADAFLALRQYRQIVDLASRLFRVFMDAGMLTGALTAIAYVKDAAASETLTKEGIETVRKFLRRAERQPELLFVPPPEPPT
jgi:tetratricopeptide (TPR) repeat protein